MLNLYVNVSNLYNIFVSFVYAKCITIERRALFVSLLDVDSSINNFPWIIRGDLNVIFEALDSLAALILILMLLLLVISLFLICPLWISVLW